MSNTIDQRVVEMRFDNSHFERNVSTTMSTLEKLKQKLNFSGASKGLDDINTSAKNIKMDGLGSAVETVTAKFSALQVMGVTALANITNSAVNAGKNIVKSLTIDPIKTGFNEYELKMGSIQTIMAGTGESLDRVNQKLNELNTYSDQTIYSFKDMTDNIGKFTNAGVNLDDAVAAIKGISNAAALSGATSNEASRAMYNFSQALSSGYVQLTDWRSIELANMATSEFRQQLIDAAVATGSLTKESEGLYKTLDGNEVTVKNFRTTLQDKWLTSEALVKALNEYADATTDVGARATAAATQVKTFTMMMDTLKESAQSGWAQTWEILVGDFEEAKSFFTEMSGIFGDIIGESADRRNSFFNDALGSNYDKLIDKIGKAGYEVDEFEESLRKAVGENRLDGLIDEFGNLKNVLTEGKVSTEDIKNALSGMSEASEKVSSGLSKVKETLKFGSTGDDVKEIQQALIDLGYDLHKYGADGTFKWETQQAVKAFQKDVGIKHDAIVGPETLAALKEAVGTTEELTEKNGKLADSYDDLVESMTKKSGRELLLDSILNIVKAIHRPLAAFGEALRGTFSISPDQLYNGLEKLSELTDKFVMKGILDLTTWDELIAKMDEWGISSGDFSVKLTSVLKDHGVDVNALIKQYGSLKNAFDDGAISIDHVKEALLGFDGITESLLLGDDAAEKLRRTFKGLFSILKVFTTFAGGGLSFAFRILQTVLGKLDLSILDFTAMVGDALTGFSDFVNNIIDTSFGALFDWLQPKLEESIKVFQNWFNTFKEVGFVKSIIDGLKNWPATIEKIGTAFGNGSQKIKNFLKALEGSPLFQTVSGWITAAADTISGAISEIQTKFEEFDASAFMGKLEIFGGFLASIAGSLANSETFVSIVDMICGGIAKLWGHLTNFKLPEFNLANLTLFSKQMTNFEGVTSFGGIFSALETFIKDSAKYQLETVQKNIVTKFAEFWQKAGEKVIAAFEVCKNVAKAIKEFIFGTEKVDLKAILDVAEKFLGILVLVQALKTLQTLASPFDGVASALNNVAASFKWDAIAGAFKAMALALGAFALCIYVISGITDMGKAWQAFGMLAGLMVVMGGVVTAIGLIASKFDSGVSAATTIFTILGFVGALVLLLHAIKQIDETDLKDPLGTFTLLLTSLLALTIGVRAIAAAGGSSFKSVAAILTLLTALQMMLTVIDAYDAYNWTGKLDAIVKAIAMIGVIAGAARIATGGVKDGSVKGLALTILALVVSLKMMVGIIEDFATMDTGTLIKGGASVIVMLSVMALVLKSIAKVNKPAVLEKGQKAVSSFAGLATALLAVVAAIWILGKMATKDTSTFVAGSIAVGAILLAFTGMLGAVGKSCSGLKIGSIVTMMIGMGLLIAELAIIVYKMQDVPWQQSIGTAAALGGLLMAMCAALRIMGKNNVKMGDLLDWVTVTVLMTVIVGFLARFLYQLKDIQPANAIGSAVALGALLIAMSVTFNILASKDTKPKTIERWVMGLLELSLVLTILAMVMHIMDGIDPVSAIGQATALSLLLLAMSATLKILAKHQHKPETISKWANGLFALSGVVFVLALTMRMLEGLDAKAAMGHAQALSMLLIAMSGVMAVLALINAVKLDMNGLQTTIRGFAGVAAAAVILAVALSAMNGVENAIENAQALAILAMALSVAMIPLAAAGKIAQTGGMVQGVGALVVVALTLAVVINYLSTITGIDQATANAKTLANLAIALSLAMIPLAIAGNLSMTGGIAVSMIALIAVAYSLVGLVAILANINDADTARTNAITLSNLAVALTICITALAIVGNLVIGITAGVAALVVVATTMGLLVWALSSIDGAETARQNTFTLVMLLSALTNAIVILSVAGADAAEGVSALNKLVSVVTRIGTLVVAVGWLSKHIDGLEDFVDNGLGLLKKLATGLGEMISGFGAGLTSGLPEIGDNLSKFADKVGGFVKMVNDIDGDTVSNVGKLIGAIKELVVSDIISKFTPGSLDDLGTELGNFASNADEFVIAMGAIKPEMATSMETFCTALNALTEAAGEKSWNDFWSGGDTFEGFGEGISSFATGMKNASIALSEFGEEDVNNITRGAKAGEALALLNDSIPASGGVLQEWEGTQDIQEWGAKISAFADSIVAFSAKVAGKNVDTKNIKATADAAQAIADVNNNIPASGGTLQSWEGSKDIDDWGSKLVSFANSLVQYSEAVSGATFKTESIHASAEAAAALAEVANSIPESGGWMQKFTGEQDMAGFGTGLVHFASGITAYANAAEGIDQATVDSITFSIKAVEELAKVSEKVPSLGGIGSMFKGDKDPGAFGDGMAKLANGITTYVASAQSINDGTATVIENSGAAIEALAGIVNGIPEIEGYYRIFSLKTAIDNLKLAVESAKAVSEIECDFSSIKTIATGMTSVTGVFAEVDVASFSSDAAAFQGAMAQITSIASSIAGLSGYNYGGVDTLKGALNSLAEANVDGVIAAFSGKAGSMTAAMNTLVNAMTTGLATGASGVSESAGALADSAINAVSGKVDGAHSAGVSLSNAISSGIRESVSTASGAGSDMGSRAVSGVRSKYADMAAGGRFLGTGFAAGVRALKPEAYNAGFELGEEGVKGLLAALAAASPSRKGIQAGKWLGEGLVIGIDDMDSAVYRSGEALGDTAVSSMTDSISRISDAINTGIDAQPTIRPVLDLDDVRAGSRAINSMLNSNPIALMTNVGAVSTMMSRRGQNGAESEVVSAITKLRRDIANMPRESYNINGVTYDDGSNIKSFAEAVVHQAKLERRV